jgi:heme/copper-type cytochrome/quinol oxidase subunit 2
MSFGERDAITGLLTTLIVAAMFYVRLSGQYEAGLYDGPDGMSIWARSVLWMIAVSIAVAIAVSIAFTILYVIVTGEKKPQDLRDERDRMIEIRGMRIGAVLISIGIVAAIMDMAWGGASALRAFTIILIGCSLSEIIKDSFKIICYRRGF